MGNVSEHSRAWAANQQEPAEREANWTGFFTEKEKEQEEPWFHVWQCQTGLDLSQKWKKERWGPGFFFTVP